MLQLKSVFFLFFFFIYFNSGFSEILIDIKKPEPSAFFFSAKEAAIEQKEQKKLSKNEKNLKAYKKSREKAAKQKKQEQKQKEKEQKKLKKKKKKDKKKKFKHPLSYSNKPVYGPFFTAEFLYAKPKSPNFLPAKTNLNDDPTSLKQKAKLIDFDWEIGWKIGFGLNFNRDQFDLYSYWTSLSGKKTETLESDSYEIQTMARFNEEDLTSTDFVNYNSSYIKFDLDTVDVELGKSFYTSKLFSMRPAIGFKWAYLKKEFFIFARTSLSENFPKHMTLPYKYNGYGLSFALNNYFQLARHFCILAELQTALLYGRTKITLTTVQDSGHLEQENLEVSSEEWLIKPYFKIFAGCSIGGNLLKDKLFLAARTGWQFELWPDIKSTISNLNDLNSTLQISSFVFSLRAEF